MRDIDIERALEEARKDEDGNDIPNECEVCGKKMYQRFAETSYHLTFEYGKGGKVLCGKHLDEYGRR